MSDFFTRLAARGLGQAEVVRPRVPSMFEPAGGVSAGASLPFGESEVAARAETRPERSKVASTAAEPAKVDEQVRRADLETPRSFRRVPTVSAIEAQGEISGKSAAESARSFSADEDAAGTTSGARISTSAAFPIRVEAPANSSGSETNASVASVTNSAFAVPRSVPFTLRPAEMTGVTAEVASEPLDSTAAQPRRPNTIGPLAAAPVDVAGQLARLFGDERATDGTASVTARTPFAEQGAAGRSANQAAPLRGESMGRQPESSVQVTIGRVEVRAIFPEAPSQQKATRPGPKTLSLDDYLTRRSRGAR